MEKNIPYSDLLSFNIGLSVNKKHNSHGRTETKSMKGSVKDINSEFI